MIKAQQLNAAWQSGRLNRVLLVQRLREIGDVWYELISKQDAYLFSDVCVFISTAQLQHMENVIAAVERVVKNDHWQAHCVDGQKKPQALKTENSDAKGVFYGYDFHLNEDGVHLIEINTNAGGGFLNAVLIESQCDLPGNAVAQAHLDDIFVAMFRNEWQLARGDLPLNCIAIVDEQPEQQYLYPEFILAQRLFERAGIRTIIVDPADLHMREEGLYFLDIKVDFVYNRLTDFSLQQYPALLQADSAGLVVVTPKPVHYACYADKRNLVRLTDKDYLRQLGVNEIDIATLQAGIPHTFLVQADQQETLWMHRKKLFFKPNCGFGGRGAYRGEKLTRRVFGDILRSDYVAQQLAVPGERCVAEGVVLKYDVRCYVYDGEIQLLAARLYQGQTTNFRTQGGGFSPVRVLD